MHIRPLGRTSLHISEIGTGLWGMGSWSGATEAECKCALQLASDLGCTFFDSAWSYGAGRADAMLGDLVAANRGRTIFVAGKIPPKNMKWPVSGKDPLEEVFPVDHVIEHAERAREAMRVDTIDVLQYHGWDDAWVSNPVFEQAVHELKKRKLIRAFGLSLNRLQPNNGLAAIRTGLVDCVQVVYNIFDQAAHDQLFPLCIERGIGVIARVPLDEGSLGGKLTLESRFPPDDYRSRYFTESNLRETLRRVEPITGTLPPDLPLPQAALAFVLSHPAVSTVIVGMRRESHIRTNLAASARSPLHQDLLAKLRAHRWDRT
ncbi:MAG: aldo/keto reductase [Planctomycetota bacterium]|nr:aldo/keto reductase [Planctomycetota bacterium]